MRRDGKAIGPSVKTAPRVSSATQGRNALMPQPRRWAPVGRRLGMAGVGALLVLALVGLGLGRFQQWRVQRALSQVERQLAEAPPDRIADLVHELCADRVQRPTTLARLLASQREAVALVAAQEIESLLIEIESLHDAESARSLAAALGRATPSYGPSSRAVARSAALRLLTLAGHDDGGLLDLCDAILGRTEPTPADRELVVDVPLLADATAPTRGTDLIGEPWPELMHLPGGGLPTFDAEVPRVPRGLTASRIESPSIEEAPHDSPPSGEPSAPETQAEPPARLPQPIGERALERDGGVEMRLIDPRSEAEPLPESTSPTPPRRGDASPASAELPSQAPTKPWASMNEAELLDALRDATTDEAHHVEAELRELGFEERHLELARRLTSPNLNERLEWTNRLPGFAGIEADAWLAWLCQDRAPEVRGAAIALLATADAEQAEPILLQMSRSDPDAQLRQLAAKQLAQLEARDR